MYEIHCPRREASSAIRGLRVDTSPEPEDVDLDRSRAVARLAGGHGKLGG